MAINSDKYVSITSGVAAGITIPERQLIGRLFTINAMLPPGTQLEFTTAAAVGTYFGTASEEYKRAAQYFGWTSKNVTRPQRISFARWVKTAVAPMVYGSTVHNTAAQFMAVGSAGSFKLTLGGVANTFTNLNFGAVASLADVASVVQTAIRAVVATTKSATTTSGQPTVTMTSTSGLTAGMLVSGTGISPSTTILTVDSATQITLSSNATVSATNTLSFTSPMWGLATVTFNAVRNSFDFVGGTATAATILVEVAGSGTDVASKLGWLSGTGLIIASGSLVETLTDCLTASVNLSDNFGSFLFMVEDPLSIDQVIEIATWNAALNVTFQFYQTVTADNATAWFAALVGFAGTGLILTDDVETGYPDQAPMQVLAATRYERVNAVQNYMYQQFPTLTPTVTTTADSDLYDSQRINYIGVTQTAGQYLAFFQTGVLMGGTTDPLDMNTYANEQWLKSAAKAILLNLLLALARVSANAQGRSQVIGVLQDVINRALLNGTISVGKDLTEIQKTEITVLTGDENAWYQVQNAGYWLDAIITTEVVSGITRYKATYTLIYSKDDDIRSIDGTHILI